MAKAVLVLVIVNFSNTLGKYNEAIESRIVEGIDANIKDFGYAAQLGIHCDLKKKNATQGFSCGSSILNQFILLTAAHCLAKCRKSSFISVRVGSAKKYKGVKKAASNFVIHKEYGFPGIANDIALVKLNGTLNFGKNIYRVVLMRNPPYDKFAVVSGWGLINELPKTKGTLLQYTKQRLWSRCECLEMINLPKGALCAGEMKTESYASFGDSGSALVVRNSIQVGIVSYKITGVSRSLVVYTNASYYYDWIQNTAKRLNCNTSLLDN